MRMEQTGGTSGPAKVHLVVFDVGRQRHAFPVEAVERVLPMVALSPLPSAPVTVLGLVCVSGEVIPVLDLRLRCGLQPQTYGLSTYLLLARSSRIRLAFPVDEVLGVAEVEPETVTPADALVPGLDPLRGVAVLEDGLVYIHDLDAYLSLDEEKRLTEALKVEAG